MTTKPQTPTSPKADNIFVSSDGEYVAIKIPDTEHSFDVWAHDASVMYEGTRYIERPDATGEFAPRRVYQKRYTHPKLSVGVFTKRGATAFELELLDGDEIVKTVRFNVGVPSLASSFVKRREKKDE